MSKKGDEPEFRIGPQPVLRRAARPSPRKAKPKNPAKSPTYSVGSMRRISHRAPEVVVRITGRTKGFKHIAAHLNYIHRHGKLEGQASDGSMVLGKDAVNDLAREWFYRRDVRPHGRQDRSSDTVNVVFSMPEGAPRDAVSAATRTAAERLFGERYDYVAVTHTDTAHPHVHVTVLARGRDGSRLNPGPDDIQRWREAFAEAVREQGVEAEASFRDIRGVVRKSVRQAIWHIAKKEKSGYRADEVREAIATVTGQVEAGERPWEGATQKRQAAVRKQWIAYADQLDRLDDPQLAEDARAIRAFVSLMPEPITRREQLERSVLINRESHERPEHGREGQCGDRGRD